MPRRSRPATAGNPDQSASQRCRINPMQSAHGAPRCKAKSKRTGEPCRAPAVRGVCRMHGASGGAPIGKQNGNYRHGNRTREVIQAVRYINLLSRWHADLEKAMRQSISMSHFSALAAVTFNHGVEGSSPSALTNKIKDLREIFGRLVSQFCLWEASGKRQVSQGELRRPGRLLNVAIIEARQIPYTLQP